MIRLSLLLAVAGVTGAVASSAPQAAPKPAVVTYREAVAAKPAAGQPVTAAWFSRYGFYNARTGSMSLIPVRNGEGC